MRSKVKASKTKPKIGYSKDDDKKNLENTIGSQRTPNISRSQVPSIRDSPATHKMPRDGGRKRKTFRDLFTSHQILRSGLEREPAAVLPGQPVQTQTKFRFYLGKFPLPEWVYTAIETKSIAELYLEAPLGPENYVNRLQTLLWVEEAHQSIEMRSYDLSGVTLERLSKDFFLLAVPGLAEGRPSLLPGDKLVLKRVSGSSSSSYCEGYIHEIRLNDILIKLHKSLHSSGLDGFEFDVSFMLSRIPFRKCHQAVSEYRNRYLKIGILFPKPPKLNHSPKPMIAVKEDSFRWKQKYLDNYQKRAVINVLEAKCRPTPYIIFGPPGTGKTVTMIESVLQVYDRLRNCKILVCANSNTCADVLATRIKESGAIPSRDMVRVLAFHRMAKLIPPNIEDITKELFSISDQEFRHLRVIITTCSQSGALNNFRDKFDYVFIDEAGHASEPEALISISVLKEGGCIVLAGDPHQLGPICMSHVSAEHGLGTSLLERLYKLPVYQRQMINSKMAHDDRYLTKLIICYRSDPRVMVVNNELFYDNELKFLIKTPKKLLNYLKIENPLVFHEIKGKDMRELMNPSWFNQQEAIQCLDYARRLYKFGLKPHQLGIITPYRQQIAKLNTLFERHQLAKCEIATMEAFQGDEKEVIIISTVRTRPRNLKFDQKFNLGFLFNPKRFNVALSRAKWLVLVVGDPNLLSRDDCWAKYINTAQRIKA